MSTPLQAWDGQHYLCAEPDGRVVADRTAAGPWEAWDVERLDGGRVAFKSAHGKYLCAEPDGSVVANRDERRSWETWEAVTGEQQRSGFKSAHGRFLVAEEGGGGVVRANRTGCGPWESWRLDSSTTPGGPHPDPLRGALRLEDRAFCDDTGPRLPCFVHAGNLIGHGLLFGVAAIEPYLDLFAATGYHGLRSWWQLYTTPGGWWDQFPTPRWDPRDNPLRLREIFEAAAKRGLKWHVAAGGIKDMSNRDEDELFDLLGSAIRDVGWEHFALIEGGNEIINTGDVDDLSPMELWRLLLRVQAKIGHGRNLYALTSAVDESRESLRHYMAPGAGFWYLHGYRGGRAHDKIRHTFSNGYQGESMPPAWNGWHGEPVGVGRLVSATEYKRELDTDVMLGLGAMGVMARAAWTFMSGPGVVCTDERFEDMPGFRDTPSLLRQLPQDVMRFRTLSHSGSSKQGLRIRAAKGEVREDYAIEGNRFMTVRYGPPEQDHNLGGNERGVLSETVLHEGPWCRISHGVLG